MAKCKGFDITCDREEKYPRKGLCNRCYQRSRQQLPHVKAMAAESAKRWAKKVGNNRLSDLARQFKTAHPLYQTWVNIKKRTTNPKDKNWRLYGGRGISLFPTWRSGYAPFEVWVLANLGAKPDSKMSIDRIDNDGNYEPGNIRWATQKEQRANDRITLGKKAYDALNDRVESLCDLVDATLALGV